MGVAWETKLLRDQKTPISVQLEQRLFQVLGEIIEHLENYKPVAGCWTSNLRWRPCGALYFTSIRHDSPR